jgi:hypothetical protein
MKFFSGLMAGNPYHHQLNKCLSNSELLSFILVVLF